VSAASDLVCVLLEEDVLLDPRVVVAPVAEHLGCAPVEARMLLRRARGMVAERVARARGEALAAALAQAGIAARVVAHEALPDLREPVRIGFLTRMGDLLAARAGDGREVGMAAFEAIHAAHAGVVGTEVYARRVGAGRFHALPDLRRMDDAEARALVTENLLLQVRSGEGKPTQDPVLDEVDRRYADSLHVYVDLLTVDAGWWRMRMDRCSYQLREGAPRMGSSLGFRYLIEHLVAAVPQERRTPMLPLLLERTPLEQVTFFDVEEYTRYTLWFFYRRWLESPPPATETEVIE
jgi:hypothetical protein